MHKAAKSVAKKQDKRKDKPKTASITIVHDGWSNLMRDAIIGTRVHNRGSPYLVNANEAGANTK